MKTKSLWGQSPKRLYQFIDLVNQRADNMRHVCVVGASDGKFVLPMLRKGLSVTAIEIDNIAIHGGEKIVPLPRKNVVKINYKEGQGVPEYPDIPYQKIMATGLLERVQKEKLEAKFELLEMDFYHNVSQNQYDAIFTSCSMQYKGNRDLSLYAEPGRSVVKNAGSLITTVECVKNMDKVTYVYIDAGIPTGISYGPQVIQRITGKEEAWENERTYKFYDITCSHRILFEYRTKDVYSVGDVLELKDFGCYSISKSSQFHGWDLPEVTFKD